MAHANPRFLSVLLDEALQGGFLLARPRLSRDMWVEAAVPTLTALSGRAAAANKIGDQTPVLAAEFPHGGDEAQVFERGPLLRLFTQGFLEGEH